ncbi:DUF397 domain-containing protein [Streptomyces sp. NPDC052396]|uniref:DUF397 domain-containing protein n=1 Tax=Streptomyces sp. NPDC052396 TaxID=3365689 RepID=UPI0037D2E81C
MSDIAWQKSSFSTDGNECIELARKGRKILVRESACARVILYCTPLAFRRLLERVGTNTDPHV